MAWVITGYKNYNDSLAIVETEIADYGIDGTRFRRDKQGINQPVNRRKKPRKERLRVFPNVKYRDFHREPVPGEILMPILPYEMLKGQQNYFVD